MIVTAALLARIDSNKVIPLIRQSMGATLPTFLQTKVYLDFSCPDQFEFSFDELVRTLHNAPLFEKPPITKSPFPVEPKPAVPTNDGVKVLMSVVIRQFESTADSHLDYSVLVRQTNISRVMLDLLFEEAVQRGYLKRNSHRFIALTSKGKLYAVENGLIKQTPWLSIDAAQKPPQL
jgi:hypothetical protein